MSNGNPIRPFDAYYSRRDYGIDEDMTRVGRGTPGGEYLRRFWHPVGFTQDLTDLPLRIRVLGEDLVLFRDLSGEIGLLELHCSHRGASLEYGIIGKNGIRCFYHGWHYGVDGSILHTPAGPPIHNSGKFCHGAYPTIVFNDLIFAYLGPPEKKPSFPMFDVYDSPHLKIEPALKRTGVMDCNWLQIQENGMDPAHTAFLHVLMSGTQRGFSDQMGVLPEMQFRRDEYGTHYIASRRVQDNVWVRVVDTLVPNINLIPPDNQEASKANISQGPFIVIWAVPIDDTNTKRFYLLLDDDRLPLKDYQKDRAFGQVNDRPYTERQRHPGDYDAMTSQGPINSHERENLATSDEGIAMFREYIREGIEDVKNGKDPRGVYRLDSARIRTRTQNTVIHAPALKTSKQDRELLNEIGRKVADGDYREKLAPV